MAREQTAIVQADAEEVWDVLITAVTEKTYVIRKADPTWFELVFDSVSNPNESLIGKLESEAGQHTRVRIQDVGDGTSKVTIRSDSMGFFYWRPWPGFSFWTLRRERKDPDFVITHEAKQAVLINWVVHTIAERFDTSTYTPHPIPEHAVHGCLNLLLLISLSLTWLLWSLT